MEFRIKEITSVLLCLTIYSSAGFANNSKVRAQESAKTKEYVRIISNQEDNFCRSASLDCLLRIAMENHTTLNDPDTVPNSFQAMTSILKKNCTDILDIYHNSNNDKRGVNSILLDITEDVLVSYCGVDESYIRQGTANILNCKEAKDGNVTQ